MTLRECGVEDESTLDAALRLQGGMPLGAESNARRAGKRRRSQRDQAEADREVEAAARLGSKWHAEEGGAPVRVSRLPRDHRGGRIAVHPR